MSASTPRDPEETHLQLEKFATILNQQGLSHLEYVDGNTHIVLKKEQSVALPNKAAGERFFQSADTVVAQAEAPSTNNAQEGAPSTNNAPQVLPTSQPRDTQKNAAVQVDTFDTGFTQTSRAVSAPLVGLAYQAKEPGTKPFVCVGDTVEEGTVLCLIEAMKMFNEVKAPRAGTITHIHFTDGELVEYGAPLFSLE